MDGTPKTVRLPAEIRVGVTNGFGLFIPTSSPVGGVTLDETLALTARNVLGVALAVVAV